MAKVFGMHQFFLHAGVKAEDFEKFITEEYIPNMPPAEGVTFYVLKGHYGDRAGKYLWVIEFDSLETLKRYIPEEGVLSDEMQQWMIDHQAQLDALNKKLAAYTPMDFGVNTMYTDYVVVE